MILVDAHVHIYDCFGLEAFFETAYSNFRAEAERFVGGDRFVGVLLLAETTDNNWFHHLSSFADGYKLPYSKNLGKWTVRRTNEKGGLEVIKEKNKKIILIAGRQIVAAEGLEVLALASADMHKTGIPLKELVKMVFESGAIPVIPWGVGKWIGRRGKILKDLLEDLNGAFCFLGDNSGRPFFWPSPQLFKKAENNRMHILPGSDPLPIADGFRRVGSFGFLLKTQMPDNSLSKFLVNELMQRAEPIRAYGKLERFYPFIRNQIAVRFGDR